MKFTIQYFWIILILLMQLTSASSFNLACSEFVRNDSKTCVIDKLDLPNETDVNLLEIYTKQGNTSEIENLSLTHPGFTSFPSKIFTIFPNLKIVFVDSPLNTISSSSWRDTNHLVVLRLYRNKISELEVNAFNELIELEVLAITESSLQIIRRGAFFGLNKLTMLNLFKNKIHAIEDGALNLPLLKELDVSYNKLSVLSDYLLIELPHLNYMYFMVNELTHIGRSLDCLKNLKKLNLEFNKIEDIDIDQMAKLPRLEELHLRESGFLFSSNIDTGICATNLVENSSLMELDIFGSIMTSPCHLQQLGVFNGLRKLTIEDTPIIYSNALNITTIFPSLRQICIIKTDYSNEENLQKLQLQLKYHNVKTLILSA